MRTHLLCAIALGFAGAASAASAQDSDTFTVQTSVPAYCSARAANDTLAVGDLSDGNGFVVTSFTETVSWQTANYYCNFATKITVTAEPLVLTTPPPLIDDSSFTDRVDYTARLAWGAAATLDDSVSFAGTEGVYAPTNANLVLTLTNPNVRNDTVRPLAGAYAGTVTLTFAAAE